MCRLYETDLSLIYRASYTYTSTNIYISAYAHTIHILTTASYGRLRLYTLKSNNLIHTYKYVRYFTHVRRIH